MAARKPPETWFWSHDIQVNQLSSVMIPGMRLVRLSSYGAGSMRRFAAVVYKEPGPERTYAVDLEAGAIQARLAETGARPVAITAHVPDVQAVQAAQAAQAAQSTGAGTPRFSVVLETGPGPLSSLHLDLDEDAARALLDDQHCIADLATYVVGGARRYAVILEERPGPSWLLTGLDAHQLDKKLLELDAQLVRLRACSTGSRPQLAAVAERSRPSGWAWYTDLDGDAVARNLENNSAYPVDLDATRDPRGVRFTVVMYRQR